MNGMLSIKICVSPSKYLRKQLPSQGLYFPTNLVSRCDQVTNFDNFYKNFDNNNINQSNTSSPLEAIKPSLQCSPFCTQICNTKRPYKMQIHKAKVWILVLFHEEKPPSNQDILLNWLHEQEISSVVFSHQNYGISYSIKHYPNQYTIHPDYFLKSETAIFSN